MRDDIIIETKHINRRNVLSACLAYGMAEQ